MKTEQIRLLFKNFWVLLGLSCVLLWCLFDYSQRFLNADKNVNKSMVKFKPVEVPNLKLHQKQKENILSLYQGYLVENKNSDSDNSQMSLADQLKQQGLLKSLHINDKQLTLKAVLKNDKKSIQQGQDLVALILVIDNVTKEQRIESFKDSSDVFGYKLSINKNSEVNLTKVHDSGVQNITLTMYKTDVKNND